MSDVRACGVCVCVRGCAPRSGRALSRRSATTSQRPAADPLRSSTSSRSHVFDTVEGACATAWHRQSSLQYVSSQSWSGLGIPTPTSHVTAYSCIHPLAAVSDARARAQARMRPPGPTPGCVYRASQSPIQPGSTVTIQPSTSTVPIAGTRYQRARGDLERTCPFFAQAGNFYLIEIELPTSLVSHPDSEIELATPRDPISIAPSRIVTLEQFVNF